MCIEEMFYQEDGKIKPMTRTDQGTAQLETLNPFQRAARIRDDVNGDGIINAVDLTLAKRGILNGFADRAAEKAADVDRNQITDAKDIAWFRQYLLVETSAYPDAGDDKTPA